MIETTHSEHRPLLVRIAEHFNAEQAEETAARLEKVFGRPSPDPRELLSEVGRVEYAVSFGAGQVAAHLRNFASQAKADRQAREHNGRPATTYLPGEGEP